MIELPDETGRPYDVVAALWLTRIETNGNGGLREVPVRRLTAAEERRIAASMAARPPERTPYVRADPIPNLEERIAAMIERDGQVTRPSIETETGCTTAQAHNALGRLRDAGRVRLRGHGAGARYVVADPCPSDGGQ